MSHDELVVVARSFLKRRGCFHVISSVAIAPEIPDAMGWSWSWKNPGSIVVECKVSRSDWLRDKHKTCCRKRSDRFGIGKMGDYRYFMVPRGLIAFDDVKDHFPDHGLIEVFGGRCKITKESAHRLDANKHAESYLLAKYLRRQ